jgi:hypothetical protein
MRNYGSMSQGMNFSIRGGYPVVGRRRIFDKVAATGGDGIGKRASLDLLSSQGAHEIDRGGATSGDYCQKRRRCGEHSHGHRENRGPRLQLESRCQGLE